MAANTDSNMFQVILGWYAEDWDENPLAVSREQFYCASSSKPYTRKQAWDYVNAARAKAERKGVDLVDIEVVPTNRQKSVWEWHK